MQINLTAEDQACVNSAINGFIISDLGEKLLNNGSGLDSKIGQNSLSLFSMAVYKPAFDRGWRLDEITSNDF